MEDKRQIRTENGHVIDRLISNPIIREESESFNSQIDSSSSFLYITAIPPSHRKREQCVDVFVDSVRV